MENQSNTKPVERVSVVGVGISATSYGDAAGHICDWASRENSLGRARYVCVTSVHGIVTARDDAGFRAILNGADLVTPDGMPVVWAMRALGRSSQQRVYGPDLMLEICRRAATENLRVFLYGGRPEVLPLLQKKLEQRFPGLQIAGSYSPPFRELTAEEEAQVKTLIAASGATLIFVGISTPKQERWMSSHKEMFPGTVMIGVGAAFDFHAGRVSQAPAWMQKRGLEWLYRLTREPKRLWKRYLFETPRFIPYFALQKLGITNYN